MALPPAHSVGGVADLFVGGFTVRDAFGRPMVVHLRDFVAVRAVVSRLAPLEIEPSGVLVRAVAMLRVERTVMNPRRLMVRIPLGDLSAWRFDTPGKTVATYAADQPKGKGVQRSLVATSVSSRNARMCFAGNICAERMKSFPPVAASKQSDSIDLPERSISLQINGDLFPVFRHAGNRRSFGAWDRSHLSCRCFKATVLESDFDAARAQMRSRGQSTYARFCGWTLVATRLRGTALPFGWSGADVATALPRVSKREAERSKNGIRTISR